MIAQTRAAHNDVVSAAVKYMTERIHLTNIELPIGKIATAVGYSKFHFTRVFADVTGHPPARYMSRLRVAEACRQLRNSDDKVLTISSNVGYASVSSFGTEFKKLVGQSPTEFRTSETPIDSVVNKLLTWEREEDEVHAS